MAASIATTKFDLKKKISGLFLIVLLVNAVIIIAFALVWSYSLVKEQVIEAVRVSVSQVEHTLAASNARWARSSSVKRELAGEIENVVKDSAIIEYVIIYDRAGDVRMQFPEGEALTAIKADFLDRYSNERNNLSRQVIAVHEGNDAENDVIAYVHLGFEKNGVLAPFWEMLGFTSGLIVVLIILSIFLTYYLAGRLSRPLQEVIRVAAEVRENKAFREVEVEASDETGIIAEIFNDIHRRLQQRINDMASLQIWSMEIGSELEKEELYSLIVRTYAENTGARRAALMLLDRKNDELYVAGGRKVNRPDFRLKVGEGLIGSTAEEQNYHHITNPEKYPDYLLFFREVSELPEQMEMLALPIIGKEKTMGVMLLADRPAEFGTFNSDDIMLYQTLTTAVGISLENARLYELAITDELTKLYIRRFYSQRLKEEIAAAERDGTMLALMMIDIDHFKDFNDTYGHPVGDKVLIALAKLMGDTVRAVDFQAAERRRDIVARYGGEEFSIILPNCELAAAGQVAERLRKNVEDFDKLLSDEGKVLRITISIGIAPWQKGTSGEDLIKCADDALYQSKHDGRNRVTIARCDGDRGTGVPTAPVGTSGPESDDGGRKPPPPEGPVGLAKKVTASASPTVKRPSTPSIGLPRLKPQQDVAAGAESAPPSPSD